MFAIQLLWFAHTTRSRFTVKGQSSCKYILLAKEINNTKVYYRGELVLLAELGKSEDKV